MHQIPATVVPILIILLLFVSPLAAQEQNPGHSEIGFGLSYVKDTIPDRLEPGRSYPVMVTFKNTGLVSWERKNHQIGMVYGGNLTEFVALPAFVDLPENTQVPPGQQISFALSLLPVAIPGQYQISFFVAYRTSQGDQRVTEEWTKNVTIVPTDGVSSPTNGSITVDSSVRDLTVFLGEQPMGITPCIIPDLKPGSYEVNVRGVGIDRKIQVQVEKSTLSRVFIGNTNEEPKIELNKINIVSNGTVVGYIEANIPLIIIISLFVIGCIALVIHGVRLRRDDESEEKGNRGQKAKKIRDDDDPAQQEKDLLDEYHGHSPLFDPDSLLSDPGSGSSTGPKIIDISVAGMKNVRKYSRDMLDKNQDEKKSGAGAGMVGSSAPAAGPSVPANISLNRLEIKPGSAVAHFSAMNPSTEMLSVEGFQVGPGMSSLVPVEVPEPVTDEYEITVSLKILSEKGREFCRYIQIPYNRGIALLARGVVEKAYEFFQQVARKQPGQVDALFRQAGVLLTWGLEQEAESVLNQVLTLDPDHEGAQEALEKIAARKEKRVQEKKKEFERPKIAGFPDSLNERYTPIRLLGKDAFASIILALRNDNGELRALKIAHEGASAGSSLFTEISVLYQLRHLNVLKMFRAEFTPTLFLELEYVSGISCSGVLCRTLADLHHPVPEEVMITFIEQIASGLAYLHSKGVRHYHLSPRHILLDEPMTPKISGIIRESISPTGSEFHSPAICKAPEQICPERYGKLGKRTDIFHLGAIWYWLMTGEIPFPDGGISPGGETGYVSGVYVSPGIIHHEYAKYDQLLKKMLALEKRERYGSVDEFLAELKGLQLLEEESD